MFISAERPRGIVWNAGPPLGNFNKPASGIQWSDKVSPPPQPQRGVIINGVRYAPVTPQTVPVGNGIRWGEPDENVPLQSRFYGPVPREPSEFIGGLNIPDDDENGKSAFKAGKSIPTTAAGPDIYNGNGVTLRFGRKFTTITNRYNVLNHHILVAPPTPPRPVVQTQSPLGFGGQPPSAVRGGSPSGPAAPGPEAVLGPKDEIRAELGGLVILPSDASRCTTFIY